jgi:hypothetical protein
MVVEINGERKLAGMMRGCEVRAKMRDTLLTTRMDYGYETDCPMKIDSTAVVEISTKSKS